MNNATTTKTGAEKMTWQDIKAQLKGCEYAIWQSGADTNTETSGRKAHQTLRWLIEWEEECDIAKVVRIGNTLYIVEQSRADWIAEYD